MLRGTWGVGKSYLWSQVVLPRVMKKPWNSRYSYVSLFGISSLSELKIALAVAIEESDEIAKKKGWWTRMRDKFNRFQPEAVAATALIPGYGKQLSVAATAIGFYLVRNRIICFDDIERKGALLSMRDFLGMVSYLSEQRGCRIIVILNSNALSASDSAEWNENKEKVFCGEAEFRPSPTVATDLALNADEHEPWYIATRYAFISLRVKNVRLIQRGGDFMRFVGEAGPPSCSQDTWFYIAKIVAVLTFSVFGRGDGGPPLEMITDRRVSYAAGDQGGGRNLTPQEEEWKVLLRDNQIYLRTNLDDALVEMVRTGVPDNERLCAGIAEYEADVDHRARSKELTEAWSKFHSTLGDNGEEIASNIIEAWPPVSGRENVSNLLSVVELLRALGMAGHATTFINNWVRERSGTRIEELAPKSLHRFKPIADTELLEAVSVATRFAEGDMPIHTALLRLAAGQEEEAAFVAVSKLGPDQLLVELERTYNENISTIIRTLLAHMDFEQSSVRANAAKICKDMCEIYAKRSPLGAYRMKIWFGFDPNYESDGLNRSA